MKTSHIRIVNYIKNIFIQRSYDEAPAVDDYQETDKRNANYNTSPVHQYPPNNRYSYEVESLFPKHCYK